MYQDAAGKTWLSYIDPVWLTHRHCLSAAGAPNVEAMRGALAAVAAKATHLH